MKFALIASLVLVVACGGEETPAAKLPPPPPAAIDTSQMAGLWNGTTVISVNSKTSTLTGYIHIASLGNSEISIGDVCGNGTGPNATATSTTEFSVHAVSCPPGVAGTCNSVVLAMTGGNGSISGGALTITGSGTLSGCGSSYPYTLSFTGHK